MPRSFARESGSNSYLPTLQHLSINVSIFTLVVIALDRYRAILWPLKGGHSKFRAKIHLIVVWILGTIIAIPNIVLFHVSLQILPIRQVIAQTSNFP